MLKKQNLQLSFKEIETVFSGNIVDVNHFTDDFLDTLSRYQEKVRELLAGKSKEEIKAILDRNTNKKVKRAIELILKYKEPEEINVGYSLFLNGESNILPGEPEEIKQIKIIEKYEEFLRCFNCLFFGSKKVKIQVYIENLDKKKMRKIPYRIVHFFADGYNKTFLISNQLGQATFVYDGIIDISCFRNISKGDEICGIYPSKVVYSRNYAKTLENHLLNNQGDSLLETNYSEGANGKGLQDSEIEKTNFNEIYYGAILGVITDNSGNTIEVDLKTIGVTEFRKLWFGRGTRFGKVLGNNLLLKHGGNNLISLKKVLKLGGIERPDLPDEEIDYKNPMHIQEILGVITHGDGKCIQVDLQDIGMKEFSKLWFGRGTRFGQVCGQNLLKNNGHQTISSLKKVLKLGGIERPDLPDEEIDYKNPIHIQEIFGIITHGNEEYIQVNLQTIGMAEFLKLWFGRGTRFGKVLGNNLLLKHGGNNLISLKKVLKLGGIERPDLPDEEIDYKNGEHIKEIFRVIADKDGNTPKDKVDIKNIGMSNFKKLWFGRGTRFGQVNGKTLLKNNGGESLNGLKQILELGGIERPDLPDEEIDYSNSEYIKEIIGIITNKDGNTLHVDLQSIGVKEFAKLWFGRGTRFGQVHGNTLLLKYGGQSLISLKRILSLCGIELSDL